jgi:hypothetical protein
MSHTTKSHRIRFVLRPAVDPTVLMPLNDIATEHTKATKKTQAATNQLLDYLATHPDAAIRYHASNMILHIHSDASYLSVSNARSRLGGMFFLGKKTPEQDTLNGSVLNVTSVIIRFNRKRFAPKRYVHNKLCTELIILKS